jgi:hypothetical protein
MNFTKLSLAALVAMGIASNASALENVKVDGSVKLWYQTTDNTSFSNEGASAASKNDGLFKQNGATGDLVAKLRATGDLTKAVGFGTTMYTTTTLGLENNLVSSEAITVGATNDAAGITNGDSNLPMWLGEAYFTYKAGKTIAKVGRQELDTPLAFTETWNAAPNTFEAAVVVNQDLPDTTLVAAYVSRGNGNGASTVGKNFNAYGNFAGSYTPGETGAGAYAAGVVTTIIPMTTLQAWYYDVIDSAKAYWLQADIKAPAIAGVNLGLGLQYAGVNAAGDLENYLKSLGVEDRDTDAYAAKLSGSIAGVNLAASYASVSKGTIPVANTSTGFTKTKLYTASILSDGRIAAQPDVKSWKVEASTKVAGFDLGASYASYDVGDNDKGARLTTGNAGAGIANYTLNKQKSPSELDLSIGTKIDDINLTAYYIMQNDYTCNSATATNPEARDRQAVRVVATINF